MESRWYLFPDQTLENTKISQRSHALHITKNAWNDITRHLDRKKIIQEALDEENDWKNYLKEGSRNMMEKWENSLENIRKKKEEDRLKHIAQKKDDRVQRFYELRKEQEKTRKEYVDKMERKSFMETGHAHDITGAFIASETYFEREKQKEFKEMIRQHEAEEEAKYHELVQENAKKEAEEKLIEKQVEREKKKNYGEYLKKVIEENEKIANDEKIHKQRNESMDNVKAAEQLKCFQEAEEQEKMQKKKAQKAEKAKLLLVEKLKAEKQQREDKELEDVINVYKEAKHNIDCMKKQRAKDLQEQMVARRDAVAKLVMAEQANRDEEEDRQIKAAIAEREAAEEEQVKAKLETQQKMLQDRLEDRKKFLEKQEFTKTKDKEIKKWEMLNHYKSHKIMEDYDEQKKKEGWQKVLQYRNDLLCQIEGNKEEIKRQQEFDDKCYGHYVDPTDEKFFEYANDVLEQAIKKGRSTHPIDKAIANYRHKLPINLQGAFKTVNESKEDTPNVKNYKNNCRCRKQKA